MVDADPVDKTSCDEFPQHPVRMLEDNGIFLSDSRKTVHREETTVADDPIAPIPQGVALF